MHIQIPAPVLLKAKDGTPMMLASEMTSDGRIVATEAHKPESMHDFVDLRMAASSSTFKDVRVWGRILKALAEAEEKRAAGDAEPWVEITDEDLKFLKEKMDAFKMGGHALRQFAPFMHALEDAKREKPKAELKSLPAESKPA